MKKVPFQVIGEYRCGHAPRVIVDTKITPKNGAYSRQIEKAVEDVPKNANGQVECTCKKCGRGMAFMVLKLDGNVITRQDMNERPFDGTYSVAPDPELN